jgi:hypothetical protein
VLPIFQSTDNSKEFPVVDVIASLGIIQGFQMVGNWALPATVIALIKNRPNSILGGIDFQLELFCVVGAVKHWVTGHYGDQFV